MSFHLTEIYHYLSKQEILRLQKRLACIFPIQHQVSRHVLHETLMHNYEKYIYSQFLSEEHNNSNLPYSFSFLNECLESFGCLQTSLLDEEENSILKKQPYVIFLDLNSLKQENKTITKSYSLQFGVIAGEALEIFSHLSILFPNIFPFRSFLFSRLYNLSARERKAWFRWLGLADWPNTRIPFAPHSLYIHLGQIRKQKKELLEKKESKNLLIRIRETCIYLDHFFIEKDQNSPLFWFYRKIMPLYRALMEQEKLLLNKISRTQREAEILTLIQLLKLGYIVLEKVDSNQEHKQLDFQKLTKAERDHLSINSLGHLVEKNKMQTSSKEQNEDIRWQLVITQEKEAPTLPIHSLMNLFYAWKEQKQQKMLFLHST